MGPEQEEEAATTGTGTTVAATHRPEHRQEQSTMTETEEEIRLRQRGETVHQNRHKKAAIKIQKHVRRFLCVTAVQRKLLWSNLMSVAALEEEEKDFASACIARFFRRIKLRKYRLRLATALAFESLDAYGKKAFSVASTKTTAGKKEEAKEEEEEFSVRLVIMGPAGCGKSTVSTDIASLQGVSSLDGDDFHTPLNKEKMRNGTPLTDKDRLPWLIDIGKEIRRHGSSVLACSALKRRYRRVLRDGITITRQADEENCPKSRRTDGSTHTAVVIPLAVVHLNVLEETLYSRLGSRQGHFAGEMLVASQLAALEPSPLVVSIQSYDTPRVALFRVLEALRRYPALAFLDDRPPSSSSLASFPLDEQPQQGQGGGEVEASPSPSWIPTPPSLRREIETANRSSSTSAGTGTPAAPRREQQEALLTTKTTSGEQQRQTPNLYEIPTPYYYLPERVPAFQQKQKQQRPRSAKTAARDHLSNKLRKTEKDYMSASDFIVFSSDPSSKSFQLSSGELEGRSTVVKHERSERVLATEHPFVAGLLLSISQLILDELSFEEELARLATVERLRRRQEKFSVQSGGLYSSPSRPPMSPPRSKRASSEADSDYDVQCQLTFGTTPERRRGSGQQSATEVSVDQGEGGQPTSQRPPSSVCGDTTTGVSALSSVALAQDRTPSPHQRPGSASSMRSGAINLTITATPPTQPRTRPPTPRYSRPSSATPRKLSGVPSLAARHPPTPCLQQLDPLSEEELQAFKDLFSPREGVNVELPTKLTREAVVCWAPSVSGWSLTELYEAIHPQKCCPLCTTWRELFSLSIDTARDAIIEAMFERRKRGEAQQLSLAARAVVVVGRDGDSKKGERNEEQEHLPSEEELFWKSCNSRRLSAEYERMVSTVRQDETTQSRTVSSSTTAVAAHIVRRLMEAHRLLYQLETAGGVGGRIAANLFLLGRRECALGRMASTLQLPAGPYNTALESADELLSSLAASSDGLSGGTGASSSTQGSEKKKKKGGGVDASKTGPPLLLQWAEGLLAKHGDSMRTLEGKISTALYTATPNIFHHKADTSLFSAEVVFALRHLLDSVLMSDLTEFSEQTELREITQREMKAFVEDSSTFQHEEDELRRMRESGEPRGQQVVAASRAQLSSSNGGLAIRDATVVRAANLLPVVPSRKLRGDPVAELCAFAVCQLFEIPIAEIYDFHSPSVAAAVEEQKQHPAAQPQPQQDQPSSSALVPYTTTGSDPRRVPVGAVETLQKYVAEHPGPMNILVRGSSCLGAQGGEGHSPELAPFAIARSKVQAVLDTGVTLEHTRTIAAMTNLSFGALCEYAVRVVLASSYLFNNKAFL